MFRDRQLTAEEFARDESVRRQIRAEFPPARTSDVAMGQLTQALKDALRGSQKSLDQIAHESGVSSVLLLRFVAGECDIHMATADKLADALGLKIASAS